MFANMLKALVDNEKIVTTIPKAKELRRFADQLITLAKKNTLASRREAIARMMIQFNSLTPKEARDAKNGDTSAYNTDRKVIDKLFTVLGPRFFERKGGYTRIVRFQTPRVGDNTQTCMLQFLEQ
jgi:large subunit ribosomal protein L17